MFFVLGYNNLIFQLFRSNFTDISDDVQFRKLVFGFPAILNLDNWLLETHYWNITRNR